MSNPYPKWTDPIRTPNTDWEAVAADQAMTIAMQRVTMQQALEALDPPEHLRFGGTGRLKAKAITALREALAGGQHGS